MKFLCDQMLAKLGRWLRAAGHDTLIIEDVFSDQEILKLALKEHRYLLTRDREFLSMQSAKGIVIYLEGNSTTECITALNRELKIPWLFAPFSRCLICNSLLVRPPIQEIGNQVPEDVGSSDFWYCLECQKVYWMGSHTEHMLEQLRIWQEKI